MLVELQDAFQTFILTIPNPLTASLTDGPREIHVFSKVRILSLLLMQTIAIIRQQTCLFVKTSNWQYNS
ncbi:hypothetical protein B9Z55_023943 [Caenorhabditis nigoni]|uniref:Uncharacterized protein n=1 Tax=Caenorhabditis nigoni TaxID=1611254 RepID=A0A2G5SRV9_9PELO|nr:hypothetical protein B9Z55_023943 [Caenorhabditis nigoni]